MPTVLTRFWRTAVRRRAGAVPPLLLVACAVSALGLQAAGPPAPARARVRLESIAGRLERRSVAILIQASEPVPYVTTQPDPLTVVVDLHNVSCAGVKNQFATVSQDAVSDVTVEEATSADGAPLARVTVRLAHATTPRIKSERSVIRVDVDRNEAANSLETTTIRKPATQLTGVTARQVGAGVALELRGNGLLSPGNVAMTSQTPNRLILDFPGVSPTAPAVTAVGTTPVDRVRVALYSAKPPVTRVVIDLSSASEYRVEPSDTALNIVFPGPARAAAASVAPAQGPSSAPPSQPASERGASQQQAATVQPPPSAPPTAAAAVPPPAPAAQSPSPAAPPTAGQAQPPSAPPQNPLLTQKGAEKQYTGAPISLDFTNADIRTVLRSFVDISGLNIIIDPAVQGTVDIALRDIPWDQALDIILRTNNLAYLVDGTVVRIAPMKTLAEEESQRRKLAEEQALGGALDTLTRTLSYANAEEVKGVLTRSALTKRGQVEVDKRTNMVIVSDLSGAMPAIMHIIDSMDQPMPQVEIEARIVQTTRSFARQLGVTWGFSGKVDPTLGNTTPLAFPNSGSISGRTGAASGSTPAMVNLGTTSPANAAIGLAMGAVNGAFNLDVALSALEKTGQGRILSTPRVLTQNNYVAKVMQGVQIPIQTVANNTVTVNFKDAALQLEVTPQITANGTVIMKIVVENASPDYTKQVNNIPPINTQKADTQVLVKDNATIVIGGIYVSQEQAQQDRTPGLHRLPLLGWLFKRDIIDEQANELLIFITPRIIKG
jgi:type IV pilus secretin PilQ/predicted competence protein